ncbi:hypothetical protein NDA18_001093 [Ustilago nuda]|nr:hypothetical protein NDA18_001093 [Ustilago nuda]
MTTPSRHRRVMLQVRSRESTVTGANPPASPAPAFVADPPASPVARLPLEPLFLGMDDDVIPSPAPSPFLALVVSGPMGNDFSLALPAIDLYEVDARPLAMDFSTPECQAAWEAELARTPTPPPAADEVINTVLLAPRAGSPVYRPKIQPLTPPPCWVACCTPPPPPPDRHLPSNGEIARWSEQFVTPDLLIWVADWYFLPDWDVPTGSLPELWLHRLVMLRLTEGCMPWPSWQCRHCFNLGVLCFASAFTNPFGARTRIPRACVHCYLAGLGHCERNIPAHPGMDYPGDGTPHLQPRGVHQAERAHLTVSDGFGPGLVHSKERVHDPVASCGWVTAMQVIWHLRDQQL